MENNRRNFLRAGMATAGGLLASLGGGLPKALAASCGITPEQMSGPFYPGERNFKQDTDLTRVPGRPGRAQGQVIYVTGRVVDGECKPIAGANVEIWQACASGRYNHSRDGNRAPMDPDFRYWAETFTDNEGRYSFKSIIPGAYPAGEGWDRPPHIHFRVSRLGYHELVTQMYFKGNPLNDLDPILRETRSGERLVVDFLPVGPDLGPGALKGDFEIALRSVR